MNWNDTLTMIFQIVLIPLMTAGSLYLIALINTKIKEIQLKTDNDIVDKYLDMLNDTITSCVLTTTQTYVDALKKQGKFDLAAQKEALNKTYTAVMGILTEEAKKYITSAVGDLETYIYAKIESTVALTKAQ